MDIKKALQTMAGLVLPATCPACRKTPAPYPFSLCRKCRGRVLSGRRPPLASTGHIRYIASCRGYEGAVAQCLKQFKSSAGYSLRHVFRELVEKTLDEAVIPPGVIDVVVPVPLHRSKLRRRGFNQSAIIAQYICSRSSLPFSERSLIKKRRTPSQMCLSGRKRKKNLEGAFSVRDKEILSGKVVLLVDDVMTTGTTLEVCAKELLKAGAKDVLAFTLARTL